MVELVAASDLEVTKIEGLASFDLEGEQVSKVSEKALACPGVLSHRFDEMVGGDADNTSGASSTSCDVHGRTFSRSLWEASSIRLLV
jgi:hypothetical protein